MLMFQRQPGIINNNVGGGGGGGGHHQKKVLKKLQKADRSRRKKKSDQYSGGGGGGGGFRKSFMACSTTCISGGEESKKLPRCLNNNNNNNNSRTTTTTMVASRWIIRIILVCISLVFVALFLLGSLHYYSNNIDYDHQNNSNNDEAIFILPDIAWSSSSALLRRPFITSTTFITMNNNDNKNLEDLPRITTATINNTMAYSIYHKKEIISKSKAHAGSYDSSGVEELPTDWTKIFFPLRNVCYTDDGGGGKPQIHFFQSSSIIKSEDATTTTTTTTKLSGEKAYQFFQQNRIPWEVFTSWKGGVANWGDWDPQPVLHNISMDKWMARTSHTKKITLYHGTSFLVPPHLPNNMFHAFNDLIIPLFRDALLSGSIDPNKEEEDQPNIQPGSKTFRNLFILRGGQEFINDRVIMFDTLFKLFHRVHYPFEEFITPFNATTKNQGTAVCFERYIWSQRKNNSHIPFYQHYGRFDEENNNHWRGIVPSLRDAINKAYNIDVPRKDEHYLNQIAKGEMKPLLVWASRTHNTANWCERCIVNEIQLLAALSKKFEVALLPINDRKQSREKNLVKALQQMANADMFGGLHGAGLGHTLLLQPGSAVFEMKDRTHWTENLFKNMANLNNVGYYAYDTRPLEEPGERQRFHLNSNVIDTVVDGLSKAWDEELQYQMKKTTSSQPTQETDPESGTCLFPSARLFGRVSSFNSSRCYLFQIGDRWGQTTRDTEKRE